MENLIILFGGLIVLLLCIVFFTIRQLKIQFSKQINDLIITTDEIQKQIVHIQEDYRQQYSDIMTELIDNKDEIKGRLEEHEDELFEVAKTSVIDVGKASTSYIQRKLGIGYSRAASLMDKLEEEGIIGPARGSEPRVVLDKDSADNEDTDAKNSYEITDEEYETAKSAVLSAGKASTSYIQRKLRIGHARSARLMDMLEEKGIIGAAHGSSPREVLIK